MKQRFAYGSLCMLLGVFLLFTAGCNPESSPFGSPADVKNEVTLQSIVQWFTVSGVVVSAGLNEPLAGVIVSTYMDGEKMDATTDADGFWKMTLHVGTYSLALSKSGFSDSSTSITLSPNDALQALLSYDVGEMTLSEQMLKINTSFRHPDAGTQSNWTSGDETSTTTYLPYNYMTDPMANITVYFNMPVDTDYTGTDFIELLDPSGDQVSFAGEWSTDKTQYTINPTVDLTLDSDDSTWYQLRILKARAFSGSGVINELTDVELVFQVMDSSGTLSLLTTQAPTLDPQGSSVYAFVIDSDDVYSKSQTTLDFDGNTGVSLRLNWPAVAGAESYKLYRRSTTGDSAGEWTYVASYDMSFKNDDGTFRGWAGVWTGCPGACVWTSMFSSGWTKDGARLSGGEKIELLVTAIDADMTESGLGGVDPLQLSDEYAPILTNPADALDPSATAEYSNATYGKISVDFSEYMSTETTSDIPTIASSNSYMTVASELGKTSSSWSDQDTFVMDDAKITYNVASTTLSAATLVGATSITVASVSTFAVGDTIRIGYGTAGSEDTTISDIDTTAASTTITVPALTNAHDSGDAVKLVKDAATGTMTFFRTTLSAAAVKNATTISLTSGTTITWAAGKVLNFWAPDDHSGYVSQGTYTVSSQSSATGIVTLTAGLTEALPAGTVVTEDATTGAEPLPRAASAVTTLSLTADLSASSPELSVAALPGSVMIGDIVIIDADQNSNSVNDRFYATVTGIDSANSVVKIGSISPTQSGYVVDSANVTFLADSVVVTGARDTNDNAQQASYRMHLNLSDNMAY